LRDKTLSITLLGLLAIYGLLLSITYKPIWVLVMVSAAIAYGFMSSLIAMRKLYFLAGASPHAALFAVTLAIPLAQLTIKGSELLYSVIIGLFLIYIVGYGIYRGVNSDVATAVFVGFTAAGSVLAMYYVLTTFPVEFDLSAIIMGDPLLATWRDTITALIVASITALLVFLTYREQLSLGIDRESARLSGINIKVYDTIVFTLLGLTVITLLKIVGYILEHVLILLPASIAVSSARSAYQALAYSVLTALSAALIGLHLGLVFNLAPSGLTGIVLLAYYIVAIIGGRR
jgi:zinc/manganese transport system permease protein